jgi:hypothetical protein
MDEHPYIIVLLYDLVNRCVIFVIHSRIFLISREDISSYASYSDIFYMGWWMKNLRSLLLSHNISFLISCQPFPSFLMFLIWFNTYISFHYIFFVPFCFSLITSQNFRAHSLNFVFLSIHVIVFILLWMFCEDLIFLIWKKRVYSFHLFHTFTGSWSKTGLKLVLFDALHFKISYRWSN